MRETRQRSFFVRLLRSIFMIITGYLALLGLGVTILGILIGVFVYKHMDGSFPVGGETEFAQQNVTVDQSILRIKLDRPLTMSNVDEGDILLSQLFSNRLPIAVEDLQQALRRATEDTRVKAILLDIDNTAASLSTITALRRSFELYRASQKPLFIHLNEGDSALYYLASVASQLNLAPVSGLTVPGPSLQLTYFGSALAKLGVELEVVKAGKYKSAMESFTQDAPSAETLEMYQALEGSLRNTLVSSIALGRKKPETEVMAWLKRSLFTSQQALSQGLVDRVGYLSDWEEDIKKQVEAGNFVSIDAYLDASDHIDEARFSQDQGTLGLIEAEGEIVMSSSGGGDQITPEKLIKQLRWAGEDTSIKAVVLRIDSPGGSALASDLIWDEVRKLSEKKPLVVSMGTVAASGGYYIAAPATLIFAEPTTVTGSIGVIGAIPKGLQVADKWGVNFHIVTGSDRRNYLNFGTPSSVEDKAILGESIKATYDAFVQKVALGRKQPAEKIYEIAEGRVYTGLDAQKLGLVDRLGGLRDALQAAKELAQMDPEKLYSVLRYKAKPENLLECLQQSNMWECVRDMQQNRLGFGLWPEVPGLSALETLQSLLRDDQTLAYWPGRVLWRHPAWGSRKENAE